MPASDRYVENRREDRGEIVAWSSLWQPKESNSLRTRIPSLGSLRSVTIEESESHFQHFRNDLLTTEHLFTRKRIRLTKMKQCVDIYYRHTSSFHLM